MPWEKPWAVQGITLLTKPRPFLSFCQKIGAESLRQFCVQIDSDKMGQKLYLIYVVDDEKVIAETLATILNRAGFIATAFEDPLAALNAAAFRAPDLLISDVAMPEMTGIDLAIQIKQANPRCEVLLFSGKAFTEDLLETARQDGHDFEILSKPMHPIDLLERVSAHVWTEDERKGETHPSLD